MSRTTRKIYAPSTGSDMAVESTAGGDVQLVEFVSSAGTELGTSGAPVRVDPTGTTAQPVSATALPLPTGAATSAKQDSQISALGATTDAKVQSDTGGSLIGFLRGLVSWFSDLVGTVQQAPAQTKAIRVQIGPGDVISSIPVVQDYPHHQVHEGESFIFCDLQTGGLNAAATYDVRVSVGALTATTRTPHLGLEFIADAAAEIVLYEGTTWTSGGTAQAGHNRNRNIADDTGTLYIAGGTALTVNSIGTPIWIGLTTGSKSTAGGTDRGGYEWVLKTSTEYCVRVTSRTAGLKFLLRLEYYKDLGV